MSVAANRYARALISVLSPAKSELGLRQLESFAALLKQEPDSRRFLENPAMAGERRNRILKEISSALGFERPVSNFIGIVTQNCLNRPDRSIDNMPEQLKVDELTGMTVGAVLSQ